MTAPRGWVSTVLDQPTTDRCVEFLRQLVIYGDSPQTTGKRGAVKNKTVAEKAAGKRSAVAVATLMANQLRIRPEPGGWTAEALVSACREEAKR